MWKYSFNLITKDLDLVKKKKQALDELFGSKKISQSTYEYLEKELKEAMTDLETHFKSLTDKMSMRAKELERQISTLELFLANLEIHRAAGEIDDEAYEKQNRAILLGLETTKEELSDIKNSLSMTVSESVRPTPAPEIIKTEGPTEPAESEVPTLVSPSEQTSA